MADKPFEPTATWLARAKREGNVARSQELSAVCGFLLGAVAVAALLPAFGALDAEWIRQATGGSTRANVALALAALTFVPLIAIAIGGLSASLLQERATFVAPSVKAERLNPVEGLKRMFSREAVISAARALSAFALASAALVPTASEVFAGGARAADYPILTLLARSAATRIVLSVIAVGALFAIVDVFVVRGRWRKKLRMNAWELKRDSKENEGDPMLRGKRRVMHRMLGVGALASVRDAAFVLANPTHIAIALEYRPPQIPVPRVLVRATDETALRVRQLANEHGIPVVENVALARQLYALAEPGDEIPVETYLAIAEVVNALMHAGSLA